MNIDELDDRDILRLLAATRTFLGATLLLMPRRALGWWAGDKDPSVTSRLIATGFGARDIAIGLGLLMALEDGKDVAPWVQAGVISDAGDFLGTVGSFKQLRPWTRWTWLLTAGSAAVIGARVLANLDED